MKSGYGLELRAELRMLRVARRLGREAHVTVKTHRSSPRTRVPPEFAGRPDAYLDFAIEELLPAATRERLADAADAYCEPIAFTPEQVARLFAAARRLGLPVKLHADQLSDQGGAALAARFGALSGRSPRVDLRRPGWRRSPRPAPWRCAPPGRLLLPLPATRLPPVAALPRPPGVPMAVATDANPGTSPLTSILAAMAMACTLFRLTPAEALAGTTRHAAHALGLTDRGELLPPGFAPACALGGRSPRPDLTTPASASRRSRTASSPGGSP